VTSRVKAVAWMAFSWWLGEDSQGGETNSFANFVVV
jgi:hypothetical protein